MGQSPQPSSEHVPVQRFVPQEEFDALAARALALRRIKEKGLLIP